MINKSIIKKNKSSNLIKYYDQTFLNKWEFLKEKYQIGRLSEYIIKRSILHNFLSTLHTCLDSQALIQMIRTFKNILGFLHYLFLHYLTNFLFSTRFIRKRTSLTWDEFVWIPKFQMMYVFHCRREILLCVDTTGLFGGNVVACTVPTGFH